MQEPVIEAIPLSFKVILLGDSSSYPYKHIDVGKTSFIKQYVDRNFIEFTKPTTSIDFVVKTCQID